jgi:hypothetical protein
LNGGRGSLASHFVSLAAKRLSATESYSHVSNQHEFDGVQSLKALLGSDRRRFPATFTYLMDDDDEPLRADAWLTWYDSREAHPIRSEFRLYYPTTIVSEAFNEGDLAIIARRHDDTLLVAVAEAGSTVENQLLWLFGLADVSHPGFSVRGEIESGQSKLEFASAHILELIGEEVEVADQTYLDRMLEEFGGTMPDTRRFSSFARSTVSDVDETGDPDTAILVWSGREEVLYRTLERHLIAEAVSSGAHGGIVYATSAGRRRRLRSKMALANHLEHLFTGSGLSFERYRRIAGLGRPDFVFPGGTDNLSKELDASRLTILGVRPVCGDRWRSLANGAGSVGKRHLYTLQTSISVAQTDEMQRLQIVPVLPRALHDTFQPAQRAMLVSTGDFMGLVRARQTGDERGVAA